MFFVDLELLCSYEWYSVDDIFKLRNSKKCIDMIEDLEWKKVH